MSQLETPHVLDEEELDPVTEEVFVIPASFAQQRFWIINQLDPTSLAYNIPLAYRIRGSLKVGVLEQSLNEVVRRHESLRTLFTTVDEQLMQVIKKALPLQVVVTDLRSLPDHERENKAMSLITQFAWRSFDLARGPLVGVNLIQLGPEDYIFSLCLHHIIADGWSVSILLSELETIYAAFSAGQPSPLPELPLQYADFSLWQHEMFQGQRLEEALGYWRQQLEGPLPVLNLPMARPRPAIQSSHGAHPHFTLPKPLSQALKSLSQQEETTLFMTLLAALQTLLYHYTGQEDIIVGSPIANRNSTEVEGVIGLFINTLVLRTDLSGQPSFRELLRRVRAMALEAYAHQELPFEKVLEAVQPERGLSHTPLFQVLLALQNMPQTGLTLAGVRTERLSLVNQTAKLDLTLTLWETGEGLSGSFEYNNDLFEAESINGLIEQWQRLLAGIVADPDRSINSLPLLTDTAHPQLRFNGKSDQQTLPVSGPVRPAAKVTSSGPRDELEAQLVQIWQEVLHLPTVTIWDNFFQLGGHSLLAVRLMAQIEKVIGVKVYAATLFQGPTIAQQAQIIKNQPVSLLLPVQPQGSKLPFFCVPGIGDNAFIFTGLAHHLGMEQPLYSFRFPEREGSQPGEGWIQATATQYIQEIKALQGQGPYLLGGYCFGGIIAFEMAQQLQAQGEQVGLVALFESYRPGAIHLPGVLPRVRYHLKQFRQLESQEKLPYLLERGKRRLWKIGRKVDPELGYSIHRALGENAYIPRRYPGRLTLFHANQRNPDLYYDPYMGWGGLAGGGIEVHQISGTHIDAYKEPNVRSWVAQVKRCLERGQEESVTNYT